MNIIKGVLPPDPIEEMPGREAEEMASRGWIVHRIPGDDTPTGFNAHTHGLRLFWPGAALAIPRPR
jgi:hypothetical protein